MGRFSMYTVPVSNAKTAHPAGLNSKNFTVLAIVESKLARLFLTSFLPVLPARSLRLFNLLFLSFLLMFLIFSDMLLSLPDYRFPVPFLLRDWKQKNLPVKVESFLLPPVSFHAFQFDSVIFTISILKYEEYVCRYLTEIYPF